jgi:hypothetical protein
MATLGKTIRMGVAALKGLAARVDSTHREVQELIDQIDTAEFVVARTDETKQKQQELLTAFQQEVIETIEGNTNDSGEREGFEVCARTRSYAGKDFVRLA